MTTTTTQTHSDRLKHAVQAALIANGWSPMPYNSSSLAERTFETAVGPRVAFVYLAPPMRDSDTRSLLSDYQSEGRNVLAPHLTLIPIAAGDDEVAQLIAKFSADAVKTINDTYAMRLTRPSTPA